MFVFIVVFTVFHVSIWWAIPMDKPEPSWRRMSTNQTGSCSGLCRSLCSCRALEMMQSHQITETSWQLHHGRHIQAWNHFEVTRSKHLSIPVAFQSLKEVPSIPPARSSKSKKVKAKLNPNAQWSSTTFRNFRAGHRSGMTCLMWTCQWGNCKMVSSLDALEGLSMGIPNGWMVYHGKSY